MNLSQEQWLSQLRQILPIVGTVLISLKIMKAETFGMFENFIYTVAGPGMIIGSAIWEIIDKSRASLIKKAEVIAQDPTSPLKALVMTDTPEGHEIANKSGPTVVAAGTVEATALAK